MPMHHQMHQHPLAQRLAACAQGQRLYGFAAPAVHGAWVVIHAMIEQGPFGRLGIVAKQLKIDVAVAGGQAMPDRAPQVRTKILEALHPEQGQFAQRVEFGRLGVGAKHRNVFPHSGLKRGVVWQGCARWQTELLDRAAFGRRVLQAFLNHQAGGHGGNFLGDVVSAGVHGFELCPLAPASTAQTAHTPGSHGLAT